VEFAWIVQVRTYLITMPITLLMLTIGLVIFGGIIMQGRDRVQGGMDFGAPNIASF